MNSYPTINIIYIAGYGRSGSTLLGQILGELDGFINIGEFSNFLKSKTHDRKIPCGCGKSLDQCTFWKPIKNHLNTSIMGSAKKFIKTRNLFRLLFPLKSEYTRHSSNLLQSFYENAIRQMCDHNNCTAIIDTSKNPIGALIYRNIDTIRLTIIHLVRDPRSVVNSYSARKQWIKNVSLMKTIYYWIIRNISIQLLRLYHKRLKVIKYEELIQNPQKKVQDILDLIGNDCKISHISGNEITIGPQHIVSGNPDKMNTGQINLRKIGRKLPWITEKITILLTWPLFIYFYGFKSEK